MVRMIDSRIWPTGFPYGEPFPLPGRRVLQLEDGDYDMHCEEFK